MAETDDEKRERVLRRLAEILQGPVPETRGSGPVSGGLEEAIRSLGLGISDDDVREVSGAIREGPGPEEAAALFQAMLEGFQDWKRKPRPVGDEQPDGGTGPRPEDAPDGPSAG